MAFDIMLIKNNSMKKFVYSFITKMGLLSLLLLFAVSCDQFLDRVIGSGNRVVEEREVAVFNAIEAGSNFALTLEQGTDSRITIEADDNLMPFIVSEVRGKTLKLFADAQFRMKGRVEIHIVYPDLNSISLSGAASLESADTLQSGHFAVKMSGASRADVFLTARELDARLSGASKLYLEGAAEQAEFRLSGASLVQAPEFEVGDCNIRASGSSKATVFVHEQLRVKASGASAVRYQGSPAHVHQSLSGSSKLTPL